MDARYYGVSSGDGNNGVSHLFPNYIVKTNDPWLLADLAIISEFKRGYGRRWCRQNMIVDGDAEYGLSAMLLDPPGRDGAGWSEANGAWLVVDVFPVRDDEVKKDRLVYETLNDCFGRQLVKAQTLKSDPPAVNEWRENR